MTTTTKSELIRVRIDADLHSWLDDRSERAHTGSPDVQARLELGLLRDLMAGALAAMHLTLDEAQIAATAMHGSILEMTVSTVDGGKGIAWMECADALVDDDGSGPAEGTVEARTLDILSRLSPLQDLALRDALSRWWDRRLPADVDGFAAVGLTVAPEWRR